MKPSCDGRADCYSTIAYGGTFLPTREVNLTDEPKLAALRAAIDEGDISGVADDNVFERVRAMIGVPATPR